MRSLRRCVLGALVVISFGAAGHATADTVLEPVTTPSDELDVLQRVSVMPSDLADTVRIVPYTGGNEVAGRVSLDLCGGGYASERNRTGRFQVAVLPTSGPDAVELASVEAIGYRDEAAARGAISELVTKARICPRRFFVPSGVADGVPLKWRFHRAPDANWKHVDGVQRVTFDVTLRDEQGRTGRQQLVYLRHGRFVVGIYGAAGDLDLIAAPALRGERGLVDAISGRLAVAQ